MKKTTLLLIAVVVISSIAVIIFWDNNSSIKRPQEPTKLYGYHSEDVTFQNTKANITLAGTLTLPSKEGNYPVVILISGQGPQNRDEEVYGHKPFLIIADYLTRNGIAVLRYDDRGFSQSSGDFASATSLDFATDVESAISYLKTRKEINKDNIGLIGHSEGGLIAPIVASKSKEIGFIILLGGVGLPGDKLMMIHEELIERAFGVPETEIQKSKIFTAAISKLLSKTKDPQAFKADLNQYVKGNFENIPTYIKPPEMTKEEYIVAQIERFSSPWWQFILRYDPAPTLQKVTCPVLALNGEKDLQVPPQENLTAIGNALKKGGNTNVTIKELPNLNHFFQECTTGSPAEYAAIEQTFSPTALTEISNWILKQVK